MIALSTRRMGSAFALGLAITLTFGCSKDQPSSAEAKPGQAKVGDVELIKLDPKQIQISPELAALVKLGAIESMNVKETLKVSGRLDLNAYNTARIGAPVVGRISDITGQLGQLVRPGQSLALISSQDLTAAQLAFLKANSALQLTSRAVERAELLLAAEVIGSAELQRRQAEQSVASAEKRAAADQLRVLGLTTKSVAELETTGKLIAAVPIVATQIGTIIERKIAVGQVVQPADALFVVSDLNSLWAQADVPEQAASKVKMGQTVEITIPALNNATRTGRIVFVADVVNPETRTVRVGVNLDNTSKELKPQMLISMLVDGGESKQLVVPSAAVVRENDLEYLFVETAPSLVALVPAKFGPDKQGTRALLEPLQETGKIVLEGAFHLNNERTKRNLEGNNFGRINAKVQAK